MVSFLHLFAQREQILAARGFCMTQMRKRKVTLTDDVPQTKGLISAAYLLIDYLAKVSSKKKDQSEADTNDQNTASSFASTNHGKTDAE